MTEEELAGKMVLELWGKQRKFQQLVREKRGEEALFPADLPDVEKMAYIRTQAYALVCEVVEATDETGWKDWATSNHINRDEFRDELVDALHFFVNLCLVADIWPIELLTKYGEKLERNFARQQEGYDGKADKCPHCTRELDKPLAITLSQFTGVGGVKHEAYYCTMCAGRLFPGTHFHPERVAADFARAAGQK